MTDDRELSALLRDAMAAEAGSVTAGADLADRILHTATNGSERAPRQRLAARGQAWLLPALAAVVVAILAGSVVLGSALLRSRPHQPSSAVSLLPTPGESSSAAPTPTPTPSRSGTPTSSGTVSTPSSTGLSGTVPAGPAGGPVPAGFRAVDLTWRSSDEGWALGTAPCSDAPCTSVVRTRDGGRTWVGVHAPTAELRGTPGCTSGCVTSLRFADNLVGYAFGPDAFYATVNGGDTWTRQSGGADALEIAGGTVLRVTTSTPGCPPGCVYRVQRSPLGSSSWQDVVLPAAGQGVGVQLVRSGPVAALLTLANPAGGAGSATSVLFTSGDDGASWTARGEPCPRGTDSAGKPGVERDSRAVALAADRSLTVLCAARGVTQPQFTMTSTDAGASFTAAPATLPQGRGGLIAAASAKVLLVEADQLYRSTDGGRTWRLTVDTPSAGAGPTRGIFLGFESSSVGRLLAFGQTDEANLATALPRMWTTSDAGATWDAHTFG